MSMKPTREQIESATPEELRIWCAEMMGWKKLTPQGHESSYCLIEAVSISHYTTVEPAWVTPDAGALPNASAFFGVPQFATDIAAAMEVEQSIGARGERATSRYIELLSSVTAPDGVVRDWYSWAWGVLRASPADRCRAALLWWIEQGESEA